MRKVLIVISILVILVSCRNLGQSTEDQSSATRVAGQPAIATRGLVEPTLPPTRTPTPTRTATPTQTPTPTPSPTPTAQPIAVVGDPRLATIAKRSPLEGTDCGLVDILDFPLNPPDGDGVARGGTDFGVYRNRYEQYHTGEDWWTSRGGRSFGEPVYSIGNGRVTYAAPLGWGRDQGIVIIRHTFDDGRQFLSFYGHLDPPSVVLSPGECVRRGQEVGNIGRPRTPPHLHFEIRTHMPNEPGGGYWWQDPTLDGWLPPSQTIWEQRMNASPGVVWLRSSKSRDSVAIGLQDDRIFVILEEDQIIGLDSENGEQRWSIEPKERPETVALDASRPILYAADQFGRVEAYPLPNSVENDDSAQGGEAAEPLWQVDLDVVGIPRFIPLSRGGIILTTWNDAIGLSADGEVLWQSDAFDRPLDWVPIGDHLLISTVGRDPSLWTANETGLTGWQGLGGGALAAQNDHVLLFNDGGLFRLNPDEGSGNLLSDWPRDGMRAGDVLNLGDGGALVAHFGRADRRLIRFDEVGDLIWQRAVPDEVPGTPTFLTVGDRPYLVASEESGSTGTISVYAIDFENAGLIHLFKGGTRMPMTNLNSVHLSADGKLFLNIGGGHLVCLDLESAAVGTVVASNSLLQ